MNKHDKWELQSMQASPLSVKVSLTKQRIREWVNAWGIDGVYVSFSGGKDSTVLLHIAREMYPDIKAVFINTGLEYPEIVQFVKTFDNVDIIRPKMSFRQVIEKYGYPFISKEVSECVYGARKYLTAVLAEQNAVDRQTDRQTDRQIPYAYRLDRLLGTGEFQSRRKNSQTINRSEIYEGGYNRKYRKLRGLAEFSTSSNSKNSPQQRDTGRERGLSLYKQESLEGNSILQNWGGWKSKRLC